MEGLTRNDVFKHGYIILSECDIYRALDMWENLLGQNEYLKTFSTKDFEYYHYFEFDMYEDDYYRMGYLTSLQRILKKRTRVYIKNIDKLPPNPCCGGVKYRVDYFTWYGLERKNSNKEWLLHQLWSECLKDN